MTNIFPSLNIGNANFVGAITCRSDSLACYCATFLNENVKLFECKIRSNIELLNVRQPNIIAIIQDLQTICIRFSTVTGTVC
jgi:hypothetical protein